MKVPAALSQYDDLVEWVSFIFFVAASLALWRGHIDYAILAVLTAIWCKL
jgi:hypothetical protein